MPIITLPNLNLWSNATWGFLGFDTVLDTMNGNEQIIKGPPPRRTYQINLVALRGNDIRLWSLALEQLTDFGNNFKAEPPDFESPAFSGANPLVNGAAQLGKSVNIDGGPASTEILKQGQYFEINSELKRATAAVVTDIGGLAVLPFYPSFRKSPLDNAVVVIDQPRVTLRLVKPFTSMDLDNMTNGHASITAIETWS